MSTAIRLAVFASGQGTNAISILNHLASMNREPQNPKVKLEFIFSDNPTAPVLEKAKAHKVQTYAVAKVSTKQAHELAILRALRKHQIDWICLAGYMRILSADFLNQFKAWHEGRSQVVNIHPSLLPLYPGIESIERAFQDQVSESGVTLHYVDEGVDTGKVIYQEKVRRENLDTLGDFKQRIHIQEYEVYKKFLNCLAAHQIETAYFKEV